jgi:hypothetical protein
MKKGDVEDDLEAWNNFFFDNMLGVILVWS